MTSVSVSSGVRSSTARSSAGQTRSGCAAHHAHQATSFSRRNNSTRSVGAAYCANARPSSTRPASASASAASSSSAASVAGSAVDAAMARWSARSLREAGRSAARAHRCGPRPGPRVHVVPARSPWSVARLGEDAMDGEALVARQQRHRRLTERVVAHGPTLVLGADDEAEPVELPDDVAPLAP